jgi:glycosyltransferase involved in cell wall biosynthesis
MSQKRLRVAVNARFLLPDRLEGFGWYTHELVRRMVAAHPETDFILLFDRPFDQRFVYGPNVTPVVVRPPARHPVLFWCWFEWAIPRVLKRYGADVFFSPDSFLSLRTPVPTLLTIHDVIPLQMPEQVKWVNRLYYQRYLARFAQRANRILTVSEHAAAGIVTICAVPRDKVQVVYNGCRDIFEPLSSEAQAQVRQQYSKGQSYFFYTGAIHPRKNIPALIQAFDQFKADSASPMQLLLAGRFAWETGAVRTAWEQSPYRSDIQMLGYVSDEVLAQLMGSAQALVNISLSEGFGLPVLEAFNCDTPVICSNSTAFPEVAGDAALLLDPNDQAAIVAALHQLSSDEALRQQMIERGRLRCQHFNWDSAAAACYAYLTLLAGRP